MTSDRHACLLACLLGLARSPHCWADLAPVLTPPSGQKTLPPRLQGKTPGGLARLLLPPSLRLLHHALAASLSTNPKHTLPSHSNTSTYHDTRTPPYTHYPIIITSITRYPRGACGRGWHGRQEQQQAGDHGLQQPALHSTSDRTEAGRRHQDEHRRRRAGRQARRQVE